MVPTLGRPVLATSGRAFIPDAFLSLASSAQRLNFIGFDIVFLGIDYFSTSSSTASPTLSFLLVLDGSVCIISSIAIPLRRLHRHVSVILHAYYAPVASCAATSTSAPHHDIGHSIPSHGYLDQGCSTHRSLLVAVRLM
jgi:hypothetical protein